MQMNQQSKELSSSQLEIRTIAEEYLRIQQNTQFLTHLFRYDRRKKKVPLRVEPGTVDIKSLYHLMVQLSYLLFTCYVKKVNIYINDSIYAKQSSRKQNGIQEPYSEYILEKDFHLMPPDDQIILKKHFRFYEVRKCQNAYGEYALYHISKINAIVKSLIEKAKHHPNQPENKFQRQYQSLESLIKEFLQPKLNAITNPKIIILSLEETEVFRESSLLLKVMNNSVFSSIRYSQKSQDIFRQLKYFEESYAKTQSGKISQQNNIYQFETCIEQCLNQLVQKNIFTQEVSKTDSKNSKKMNEQNKSHGLGEVDEGSEGRRYSIKIQNNEKGFRLFNEQVYNSIVDEVMKNSLSQLKQGSDRNMGNIGSSSKKNQYIIEYIAKKNVISVKYITDVELNIENTDLIMFQCNNISSAWNSVTMELIEKSINKQNKRKERFLAYRTTSYLNSSEKPIFKILLMMDLVMLSAKITEPELKRNTIKLEDFSKIQEINLKINHLIKMFIKKIQKFYHAFSETQK